MQTKKLVDVWFGVLLDLTRALGVLAQLKLDASVELSGNQTIGYNHHHSWDEEQYEQQQHVPGKEAEWEKIV